MKFEDSIFLKREFNFEEQNFALIKAMVFIYAFKKAKINYPLFEVNNKVINQNYLINLHDLAKDNLKKIYNVCGEQLGCLINDCLENDNSNVELQSELMHKLFLLNNFTSEDIEKYITNKDNYIYEKNDFSSPKSLIDLVIGLLSKGTHQSWFDLGCGNGDFLIELVKKNKKNECYGEDINYNCQLLTKIRLFFANANAKISENNIITSQYNEIVDVAYANIPFLMRLSKTNFDYNKHNKYVGELKPTQNADWIFADRLLQSIKDRGIILMTEASLMNFIDIEQRKNVIEQNLVEGIIKLPDNLFIYTGIPVSIVIFNKHKDNQEIKFLDASNMCKIGRRLSELNVSEIISAYNAEKKTTKVNIKSISKDDYSLHVKKYLDVNEIFLENEVPLEKVVNEVFRGAQISAPEIDEYCKNIKEEDKICKLITVGDIQDSMIDINKLQIIKDDGKYNRYVVKNGDVLVSSKSTKIKTTVLEIPKEEKFIATGSLLVIRCDQEKINPFYLKAFFDSTNGKKLLESIQTGTTIISINATALMRMRISCIDKKKQDKIAERYLLKLEQFKSTKLKLYEIEKELINVFDNSIKN